MSDRQAKKIRKGDRARAAFDQAVLDELERTGLARKIVAAETVLRHPRFIGRLKLAAKGSRLDGPMWPEIAKGIAQDLLVRAGVELDVDMEIKVTRVPAEGAAGDDGYRETEVRVYPTEAAVARAMAAVMQSRQVLDS